MLVWCIAIGKITHTIAAQKLLTLECFVDSFYIVPVVVEVGMNTFLLIIPPYFHLFCGHMHHSCQKLIQGRGVVAEAKVVIVNKFVHSFVCCQSKYLVVLWFSVVD